MVSLTHSEERTVMDAKRNPMCCSAENTVATTSHNTADQVEISGESIQECLQSQNSEDHDRQPQCSRQNPTASQSSTVEQCAALKNGSVHSLQSQYNGRIFKALESTCRSTNGKSVSVLNSRLEPSPTNFRRPNLSYASAVAGCNPTTVATSNDDVAANVNSPQPKQPVVPPLLSTGKRQLSKQMSVDEAWPSIFVGKVEEECLRPTFSVAVHSEHSKARAKATCSTVVEDIQEVETEPLHHSTAHNLPADSKPQGSKAAADDFRKVQQCSSSAELDSVAVNVSEGLETKPTVGEVVQESTLSAPAMTRYGKEGYSGVVPSRARQLVRGLAMCGDDDTRLRPPRPPAMKTLPPTYASVAAMGVSQRNRNSSSLSRESSFTDNNDLNELELRAFITATLHKNPRDRSTILNLEQKFTDFINNLKEQSLRLPPASSYNRMIIHRVAVLFGLDHNVDNSGRSIVVSKTSRTKQPPYVFASLIQSNVYTDSRKCYNGSWYYGEAGDAEQRPLSFDGNYMHSENEANYHTYAWIQSNQRSFDRNPFVYPGDKGSVMKKGGSAPTFCMSNSGSVESCFDRPATTGIFHSAVHLSPQEAIEQLSGQVNGISLLEAAPQASQFSSTFSAPTLSAGTCANYPPIVQYQLGEDVTCSPYQQQMFIPQTPVLASSSGEVYPPQPPVMMPMQQNVPLQPSISMLACQQPHVSMSMSSVSQSSLDPTRMGSMAPLQQAELVQNPVRQNPVQVGSYTPQAYPLSSQPAYPGHYHQVVYTQYAQVVQQPVMQQLSIDSNQQQYATSAIYHTPAQQQQQYQPTLVEPHLQAHHQSVVPQTLLVQQSAYQQQSPQKLQAQQHYVDSANVMYQQPNSYQQISCGHWPVGVSCNEGYDGTVIPDTSEVQTVVQPLPYNIMSHGRAMKQAIHPLSVLVQTEPMYHYSQTSPIMSSMQQQQMMQFHGNPRPLLYRNPHQYMKDAQVSVDGGYCSMTQESIRECELAAGDA